MLKFRQLGKQSKTFHTATKLKYKLNWSLFVMAMESLSYLKLYMAKQASSKLTDTAEYWKLAGFFKFFFPTKLSKLIWDRNQKLV